MSNETSDNLDQLLRENACRRLIESYTYALDWMSWNELEALFWPEATFDFGLWTGGRSEYMPWVSKLEAGYQRRLHIFSIPRLQVAAAKGEGEVGAIMYFRATNQAGKLDDELMFGRYLLDFECRTQEWRISSLKFLMNGIQRFDPTDSGGASFFADNLSTQHPLFKR